MWIMSLFYFKEADVEGNKTSALWKVFKKMESQARAWEKIFFRNVNPIKERWPRYKRILKTQ